MKTFPTQAGIYECKWVNRWGKDITYTFLNFFDGENFRSGHDDPLEIFERKTNQQILKDDLPNGVAQSWTLISWKLEIPYE